MNDRQLQEIRDELRETNRLLRFIAEALTTPVVTYDQPVTSADLPELNLATRPDNRGSF